MRALIRQPLFCFLVIAACIFIADALVPEPREQIFVSSAQRDRLALLWQTQTGESASPEELDALVSNWLEEELLFREAMRLGLDQDDSIVRRRLVQKLGFIAEEEFSAAPERDELESFYRDNIASYTLPLRYSLRQLYFSSQQISQDALRQSADGIDISGFGENSMLNSGYAFRSEVDLDVTFGSGFSRQLNSLSTSQWQGPIESSFGFHLILITAIHDEEAAPLPSILDRVLSDYEQYQKQLARQSYVGRLMNDYDIQYEEQ